MEKSLLCTFPEKDPARYAYEANLLLDMGLTFLETMPEAFKTEAALHKEYAVGSTLHRGYYHPSPVHDLIVGNTKRGRLTRNPTAQLSHCYHYDDQHTLFRVDSYYQGRISHVEHLWHKDQVIYGFTVDCNDHLSAVCRETYENGRIVSLNLMHCECTYGQYHCFRYLEEHYRYDADGLYASNFATYKPGAVYDIYEVYEFLRENGYLVSYVNCSRPDQRYHIPKSKQRQA